MKGTIIAAMIAAAAAASAATVFALKKAHDKRLDKACNCDDLPEGGCCCTDEDEDDDICLCDTPEETADAEETAEDGEETTEDAPLHPAAVQMVSAPSVRMTMPQTSRHSSICRKLTKTAIPTKPKKRTEFPTLCPA